MSLDTRAIDDPHCIKVLASSVRQELVDTMAALGGQATVAALSEQLGLPADGLYYHMQLLKDVGLISEITGQGESERSFRLSGAGDSPLRLAYNLDKDGATQALRAYAKGLLQVAERDFQDALSLREVTVQGSQRQLWAARNKGWVNKKDLAEANRLLERLCELMSQTRENAGDQLMSLAFVLAPKVARNKRRQGKTPKIKSRP